MAFGRLALGVGVMGCLLASVAAVGSAPQNTTQRQDDEFLKGVYLQSTPGLTMPKPKTQVYPKYTADAMRAKIQGVVELQVVVLPDGTVGRARVLTSLDRTLGLDDQALAAAKRWTFEPGELGGQKVPVAASLLLEFKLH